MEYDFILASSSPRRLALLKQAGILPKKIESPNIYEEKDEKESVFTYVERMAKQKALTVAKAYPNDNIIAADTVVLCANKVLPKTDDEEQARKNLQLLSGRRHRVITAVCLVDKNGRASVRHVVSKVKFKRIPLDELEEYLGTGEWVNKAGSYAIQGMAERFVQMIIGTWSNIVGLPLYETVSMLQKAKKAERRLAMLMENEEDDDDDEDFDEFDDSEDD